MLLAREKNEFNSNLPPFRAHLNEPYGDNVQMNFLNDFESDQVVESLKDFTQSTVKFGESLLKRLLNVDSSFH